MGEVPEIRGAGPPATCAGPEESFGADFGADPEWFGDAVVVSKPTLAAVLQATYVAVRPLIEAKLREGMLPFSFKVEVGLRQDERMKQNIMSNARAAGGLLPQRGQVPTQVVPPLAESVTRVINDAQALLNTLKCTSRTLTALDGSKAMEEPESPTNGEADAGPVALQLLLVMGLVSRALELATENEKRLAVQVGRE